MLKTKLNLGSSLPPIHKQHLEVMSDYSNWQLVDLFIDHPEVMKMDATKLDEVEDGYLEHIYASHLLEHISHRDVPRVLRLWYSKLKKGGILTLNVPDMEWAARQVIKFENMQPLDSNVYTTFEGNNGIQSVIYGTHAHDGEIHKSGYTKTSLEMMLCGAGFEDISISKIYEAHDMSCLIAEAIKK